MGGTRSRIRVGEPGEFPFQSIFGLPKIRRQNLETAGLLCATGSVDDVGGGDVGSIILMLLLTELKASHTADGNPTLSLTMVSMVVLHPYRRRRHLLHCCCHLRRHRCHPIHLYHCFPPIVILSPLLLLLSSPLSSSLSPPCVGSW